MDRETKATNVASLRERFERASLAILTEYRGLAAGELDSLRREVRAAQGEYRVAKNTLTRRALAETDARDLAPLLSGPTAVVFGSEDPVVIAKVLVRFADDHTALTIKGAVLDGEYLTPERVDELAKLPGREELLGSLLALMQAPATQLVRTLNEPGAQVARLLEALRQRQESTGGDGSAGA
jgi:large subunit ribosomal protein L10